MTVFTKKEIKTIKDKRINNAKDFSCVEKDALFKRLSQHRRFCYQEELSVSLHPDFLPVYDKLDDDLKERIMVNISVLMVVKQPHGVGYVGEEDGHAIDIGRGYRLIYDVNRPLRVITLYDISNNGGTKIKVNIPNNGGWGKIPERTIKFCEDAFDDTPIHRKCGFSSFAEMVKYAEVRKITMNKLYDIRMDGVDE